METDLIVIGAGLAGSCLATAMARRGWQVLLIERRNGRHHKVCGEFLSPEVQASLRNLGLHSTVAALAPAEMTSARLVSRHGVALDMALPGVAWGVSRYVLDSTLTEAAATAGADVQCGVTATSLKPAAGGYQVTLRAASGEQTVRYARAAVVAAGRQLLPGLHMQQTISAARQRYVGVKCHYAGLDLRPEVRLYLFDGGYVGLSPIEDGRANLCLLASEAAFQRAGKNVMGMLTAAARLNPALAADLAGGMPFTESAVAVGAVDTERVPVPWDGCARIGDAVAMIPPLCGDGMAMAIHAAEICAPPADAFLRGSYSLAEWEQAYTTAWQHEFSGPLRTGRQLQALLNTPLVDDGMLGVGRLLPGLAEWLVRATRGSVAEVAGATG